MQSAKSAQPKRRPGPMDLIALGCQLAMMEVEDLYRQVMEQGDGKGSAKGEQTKGGDPKSGGKGKPEQTLDRGAQSVDFTKREMKARGEDQEESRDKVTAPRAWKSDPTHETALLAYITPREGDKLRELDMHGSGVDKKMHFGPEGVPSFQGDGTSAGSDGPSGSEGGNTPDNSSANMGGWAGEQDGSKAGVGLDTPAGETYGPSEAYGPPEAFGPPEAYGPPTSPEAISKQEDAANERAVSISNAVSNARSAGVFGGMSQAGFHDPGSARSTLDALDALGVYGGEDKFGIGPSMSRAVQSILGMMPGIPGFVGAKNPAQAMGTMAGIATGMPFGLAADVATGEGRSFGPGSPSTGSRTAAEMGGDEETSIVTTPLRAAPRSREFTEALRTIEGAPSFPRAPGRYVGNVEVAPSFGGRDTINPGALRAVLMSMGRPYPNQRSI